MNATNTDESTRLEAENTGRDAAGMTFLVAMALAGALAVVAALTFSGTPEGSGAQSAPISTR